MKSAGSIKNSLKSEAVVLAAIPFIGSLTAFFFEFGYLIYYDVPLEFIDLGLLRILKATVILSVVLTFVWALIARVIAIATSDSEVIKNVWFGVFMLICVVLLGMTLSQGNYLILLGSLLWPLLLGLMYLVSKLFKRDGVLGRIHPHVSIAYEDGQKVAEKAEQMSLLYTGPFSVLLVTLSMVAVTGYWSAKIDNSGWVIQGQPNFLLVRKYGDSYIFKEFDPANMRIGDQIKVLRLPDNEAIHLKKISLRGLASKFGESNPRTK